MAEALKCGLKLDLCLGGLVTDGDVTGVLEGLHADGEGFITACVVLDEPLVLPAYDGLGEITVYTQSLAAHRLRPVADAVDFGVIAGKWDESERNCKYSADFASLDEAVEAYDRVSGYPWAYILYKGRTLELYCKEFEALG